MPTWDASFYLKFANERTQPAIDLISRIGLETPRRIIDLGCGPGNSTAMLRQRWPEAELIGLDNSPEMIAAASHAYPGERWLLADAASWQADEPFNLVFSNAALHWLPDHAQLFTHLMNQVRSGGALAVQVPTDPASTLLRVAQDPVWRERLKALGDFATQETPGFYYDVLRPLTSRLELWETEYIHVLESPQAIVNWFRGTGMRPLLEALNDEQERAQFEAHALEEYTRDYPPRRDGRVLFPFRRFFLVAYRT